MLRADFELFAACLFLLVVDLSVIQHFPCLLIQGQHHFLTLIAYWIAVGHLGENFCHDDLHLLIFLRLFRLIMKPHRPLQTSIAHNVTIHYDEIILQLLLLLHLSEHITETIRLSNQKV